MGKLLGYIIWLAFAVAGIDLLKEATQAMRSEAIKAYQRGPISHSLFTKQLTRR